MALGQEEATIPGDTDPLMEMRGKRHRSQENWRLKESQKIWRLQEGQEFWKLSGAGVLENDSKKSMGSSFSDRHFMSGHENCRRLKVYPWGTKMVFSAAAPPSRPLTHEWNYLKYWSLAGA